MTLLDECGFEVADLQLGAPAYKGHLWRANQDAHSGLTGHGKKAFAALPVRAAGEKWFRIIPSSFIETVDKLFSA